MVQDVIIKATFDFITSLKANADANLSVNLFTAHLSGQEDTVCKYLYLVRKLARRYERMDRADYRTILKIIYPSRVDDEYDIMELDYLSYSKGKLSSDAVEAYILHLIKHFTEPNYVFFTKCLRKFDYQEQGTMSYEDFDAAMEQVFPNVQSFLKRRRFNLCAQSGPRKDVVPIEKLAYVACYISL